MKSTANIPQNLISGTESYGTTQEAILEAKNLLGSNPHSIDMVEAGLRTRTTRNVKAIEKYNIKVGDIINQIGESADGTIKNILTRVTAIHPKGTVGFLGTWNKEGWTQKGVEIIKKFKYGSAAIEFELLNSIKPSQVAKPVETDDNDGPANAGIDFNVLLKRRPKAEPILNHVALMSKPEAPLKIYVEGYYDDVLYEWGYGATFKFQLKWYTFSGTEYSKAYRAVEDKFPDYKLTYYDMSLLALIGSLSKFSETAEHIRIITRSGDTIDLGILWNHPEDPTAIRLKTVPSFGPVIDFFIKLAKRHFSKIIANGGSVSIEKVINSYDMLGYELATINAASRVKSVDDFTPIINIIYGIHPKI